MGTFPSWRDRSVLFLIGSLISFSLAYGSTSGKRTYGAEFTFTNQALSTAFHGLEGREEVFSDANRKARDELKADIEAVCRQRGNCRVEARTDRYGEACYRVVYQKEGGGDEWFYEITLDPGVIEIVTAP